MSNCEAVQDTVLPRGGGSGGTSPILALAGSVVGAGTAALCTAAQTSLVIIQSSDLRDGWAYAPFNGGPRVYL
jgi:hypothetical protein